MHSEAHDALKKAEAQAKAKAEKMHELKKLKHAIGLVAAEKGKLKEVLDDYKRYQEFLEALTPREWTEDQHRQRRDRVEAERVRRFEVKLSDWEARRVVKEAEVMAHVEAQRRQALKAGKVLPKADIAAIVAQVRGCLRHVVLLYEKLHRPLAAVLRCKCSRCLPHRCWRMSPAPLTTTTRICPCTSRRLHSFWTYSPRFVCL